jgi:hypothetical protein
LRQRTIAELAARAIVTSAMLIDQYRFFRDIVKMQA